MGHGKCTMRPCGEEVSPSHVSGDHCAGVAVGAGDEDAVLFDGVLQVESERDFETVVGGAVAIVTAIDDVWMVVLAVLQN